MKLIESSIEKKIRLNTPDYVYGISDNVSRYNCEFFNIRVFFKEGCVVHKGVNENGVIGHSSCVPDFILLNRKDKEAVDLLCRSFENGDICEYTLSDYFCSRKGLYFIEAFGDYWHNEIITGIEREQHEHEVMEAYESAGHHVLILWENDILNSWDEKCVPLINDFIARFKNDGNELSCDEDGTVLVPMSTVALSDETIRLMHDIEYRAEVNENVLAMSCDEIAGFYFGRDIFSVNNYDAKLDLAKTMRWGENNVKQITRFGKVFPWHFFDIAGFARDKELMSLREVWGNWRSKSTLRDVVRDMMSEQVDVNSISILERFMARHGFQHNLPFDFSEVVLRLWHLGITKKDMFIDVACNYGETMLAAKLLGFRKYVGFTVSSWKKHALEEFAKAISYDGASVYLASYDNRILAKNFLDDGAFVLSCTDDMNVIREMLWMANDGYNVYINTRLDDFTSLPGVDVCKLEYWRYGTRHFDNCFYSICRQDKYNLVRCEECGLSFSSLRGHLSDTHGISSEEYSRRHPGSLVTSGSERDKIILANKSKFDDVGHHRYNKRKVYLMPGGSYASRTDTYMKAWGYDEVRPEHVIDANTVDYTPSYAKLETFGVEGEDYVTCAECGFKGGNIARHLREKHNMTVEEYQAKYNGAPTKSRKVAEALHNGSLKKWQTQFANGTSTPAAKVEHAVDPKNRKRDDITRDDILDYFSKGIGTGEMAKRFGCSDVTMLKWIKNAGVEVPSKTVLAIRRAVQDGNMDLEHTSLEDIEDIVKKAGKERAMQMFGVKRTVFDTWCGMLKGDAPEEEPSPLPSVKKSQPVAVPAKQSCEDDDDFHGQLPLFGEIETHGQKFDRYMSVFRGMGFPYPSYTDDDAMKVISMVKSTRSMIDENGDIRQGASAGNDWLLSFFPNFFECRHDGKPSARQMYDKKLEHIVGDILQHDPGKDPTAGLLRKYLMEHERLTGFRPVIAKQIYDRHCLDNAAVLDPCGGWGGRMLGAYCSDKVARYDCVEASRWTADGLRNLSVELDRLMGKKQSSVRFGAFEDVSVEYGAYDMVFTSTPYYRKEHYSDDPEQSCNRYQSYDAWLDGFLRPFVEKSWRCLKEGGKFIVNIDDVRIGDDVYPLKDDFVRITGQNGFRHVETMHMNYRNRYSKMAHGEPIYVYEK